MWPGSSMLIRLSMAARIRISGFQFLRSGTPRLMPPRCDEKMAGWSSTVLMSSYLVTDQYLETGLRTFDHITGASSRIRL